ncbi:UNKNOWN [Stylonychia lemnae]|uniref:Uncharacterized protein n=1 Tax=Stylonychia lemnae TaxID=5949 RepID=A0A078B8S5_STYLE|nr:UNKNOWN [Stylonychia lemnae]|eukprot:CDW90890.1 UNKNOWN [Stylonychia lemnae]
MPWVALPYQDYKVKKLKYVFNVTELPKLVFLRVKDGSVASDDGKDLVLRLGKEAVHYLKFHQYHSNTLTNDNHVVEEQLKKDQMRQDVLDHFYDYEGYEFNAPPTDFDNRPVIGLKSDLEFHLRQ